MNNELIGLTKKPAICLCVSILIMYAENLAKILYESKYGSNKFFYVLKRSRICPN